VSHCIKACAKRRNGCLETDENPRRRHLVRLGDQRRAGLFLPLSDRIARSRDFTPPAKSQTTGSALEERWRRGLPSGWGAHPVSLPADCTGNPSCPEHSCSALLRGCGEKMSNARTDNGSGHPWRDQVLAARGRFGVLQACWSASTAGPPYPRRRDLPVGCWIAATAKAGRCCAWISLAIETLQAPRQGQPNWDEASISPLWPLGPGHDHIDGIGCRTGSTQAGRANQGPSSGRRSARPFPRDRARPDAGNRGTRRSAAVVLPRHCRGSFLLCPAKIGGYPSQDRLTFRRQPPVPTLEFSPTPSPTFSPRLISLVINRIQLFERTGAAMIAEPRQKFPAVHVHCEMTDHGDPRSYCHLPFRATMRECQFSAARICRAS